MVGNSEGTQNSLESREIKPGMMFRFVAGYLTDGLYKEWYVGKIGLVLGYHSHLDGILIWNTLIDGNMIQLFEDEVELVDE